MDYELSTDHARMQIDAIHRLLTNSYWSANIRVDVLRSAIANSLVIGAFDQSDGQQIAFARVVTDYSTFAWLCDVIVQESWRGRGLGKAMVRALINNPRMQTLRRWALATKDAHTLYQGFGFVPVPAERWMEMRLPVSAWQETPKH